QTSDPAIYAVGDAVETPDVVGGQKLVVPLAGPANRQGRIAADHALGREQSVYRGTQGTSICKIFDLTAGSTGLNEKTLKRLGRAYEKIYVHPASHAGYYPGAHTLSLKLLFDPQDGKILGAQITGCDGVDKRLDVLATALRGRLTVYDLEHLELSYAPPYGSAKDPVNFAGFVAANALRGDVTYCHSETMRHPNAQQIILDVRTPKEFQAGAIPGALNIPVDHLRDRLTEIPREKELLIYCAVGLRSYLAARILTHHGWKNRVLTGGYTTYLAVQEAAQMP
ncbi:MAG: CoA-disulfide reductase, partial [Candidatus Firestonebacteria bacterium]|nr:CoA-disulfide reductase [Candidatus Firestonebacteria bacterium]